MPRILTRMLFALGLAILVLAGLFFMFFSTGASSQNAGDMRLSSIEIAGETITLCKDERIVSEASGYIDFSQAPTTDLEGFEAFARQYSRTFIEPDAKQRNNMSWKKAARACDVDRPDNAVMYGMSFGEHPERAVYDVYVVDGQVTHIDGFYLNRGNEAG